MTTTENTIVWVRDQNGNGLGSFELDGIGHDRIAWQPVVETTANGIVVTVDLDEGEDR